MNKLHVLGSAINTIARLSPKLAGNIAVRLFIRPRRISAKTSEQECLNQAELLTIDVGHSLVGYRWKVEEGSQQKVLLIHGWESHSGRWQPLVQRLLKKGMEVIAFDGPAAGQSGGKETPFNFYIDCLQQVELHHGPFDAVVGHSLGGGAAVQLCARLDTERRPSRAVIMAAFDESNHVFDRYHRMLNLSDRVRNAFDKHITELINVGQDEELAIGDFSNVAAAKTISNTEALIIHSTDDAVCPCHEGVAIHEAWPNAELATFKDEGHRLQGEHVLDKIVQFLER